MLQLTSRFLTDFYLLVGDWAAGIVATWPDDSRQARPDPGVIAETIRPATGGSDHQPGRRQIQTTPGTAG